MTTTKQRSAATTVPPLPDDLRGWRWTQMPTGIALASFSGDYRTNTYTYPEKAIAEARRYLLSQPADATALATVATLDDCIARVARADRAGGQALLDKSAAILEARELARAEGAGAWARFLAATGLHERAAQRHLQIAERVQHDAPFAEAVRTGWLSYSVAALAASADESLLGTLLTQETPPTRAQLVEATRPDTGVGSRDFVGYAARARVAGFDRFVACADGQFELHRNGKLYARASWEANIRTIASFEELHAAKADTAAASPAPLPPDFAAWERRAVALGYAGITRVGNDAYDMFDKDRPGSGWSGITWAKLTVDIASSERLAARAAKEAREGSARIAAARAAPPPPVPDDLRAAGFAWHQQGDRVWLANGDLSVDGPTWAMMIGLAREQVQARAAKDDTSVVLVPLPQHARAAREQVLTQADALGLLTEPQDDGTLVLYWPGESTTGLFGMTDEEALTWLADEAPELAAERSDMITAPPLSVANAKALLGEVREVLALTVLADDYPLVAGVLRELAREMAALVEEGT